MTLPVLDLSKQNSTHAFIKQIYFKLFGITDASPIGSDRTGVCGGTKPVTPGTTAFDYPSFIECTGADGTITGVDEYGNTVTTYPMTVGKITPSRFTKVTAVSAGVVCWRHYSI
jgi:hypothetical protein